MSQSLRFGRRISLPSTRQIRHELLMMMQQDEQQRAAKTLETTPPSPQAAQESPALAV
jgi:hypothetical protein